MATVTLEQIESLEREMLRPKDVAPFLGVTPYYINMLARDAPEKVPFPFFMSGNRVKIPRRLFVAAFQGNSGGEFPVGTPVGVDH